VVAALTDGRQLVALLSTASSPRRFGFWVQDEPSWPSYCPLDVGAALDTTHTYAQILGMSCHCTGVDFCQFEPEMAKQLLFVDQGGAIVVIGPTRAFNQYHYYCYLKKFMEVYEVLGGEGTIGRMHMEVRNALLEEYADDPLMPLFCRMTILLGDPTVRVGGPRTGEFQWAEEEPAERVVPARYAVTSVSPNPFNAVAEISYAVPERSRVSIGVYNVQGQLVRRLLDRVTSPGEYRVIRDGKDADDHPVGSGVYFCRLSAGDHEDTRKMVLLK